MKIPFTVCFHSLYTDLRKNEIFSPGTRKLFAQEESARFDFF